MSNPEVSRFVANWTKYNDFLKAQDLLLTDMFTNCHGKRPKYEYERILFNLLHRYAMNFRTIYWCWPEFRGNSAFKFPIYSLMRPLIADALLMMYLLEEFKWLVPPGAKDKREEWEVNESAFLKRFEEVSSTFFKLLDSHLKKKLKNTELSPKDMQEFLTHHRNVFPEFYQDGPEIIVRKHKGLTPGQMFDEIVYGKPFVRHLYDHYFRLSQFEHFTIVTEGLMSHPDRDSELMNVVEVTDSLLDSLVVNISTVRVHDPFRDRATELINRFRTTQWQDNGAQPDGS